MSRTYLSFVPQRSEAIVRKLDFAVYSLASTSSFVQPHGRSADPSGTFKKLCSRFKGGTDVVQGTPARRANNAAKNNATSAPSSPSRGGPGAFAGSEKSSPAKTAKTAKTNVTSAAEPVTMEAERVLTDARRSFSAAS